VDATPPLVPPPPQADKAESAASAHPVLMKRRLFVMRAMV